MTIDLASKLEAANARIAELEALVADQKAATDEEFQNCSKAEAELAEAKAALDARDEQLRMMATDNAAKDARIAGLEAQLRHMHTFDSQHRARIAELEAYHTNCTDYINGLLGNMADDDKERVTMLDRAVRAEAQLAEANLKLGDAIYNFETETVLRRRAEAERDAMRLRFQQIECMPYSMVNDSESLRHTIKTLQGIARAALAPSPAEQETQWLANAERQKDGIDKSEVEFFGELRARAGRPFPPTSRTSPMRSCTCGLIIGSCSCPADPSPAGREG